jgi:hypothetical protein
VVAATEVLRGKTTEQLDRRLYLALSRQQAAGLDRQEQQAGTVVLAAAVALISLVGMVIPRQHHHLKVITAAEEQAPNQPVLVAAGQPQREPEL